MPGTSIKPSDEASAGASVCRPSATPVPPPARPRPEMKVPAPTTEPLRKFRRSINPPGSFMSCNKELCLWHARESYRREGDLENDLQKGNVHDGPPAGALPTATTNFADTRPEYCCALQSNGTQIKWKCKWKSLLNSLMGRGPYARWRIAKRFIAANRRGVFMYRAGRVRIQNAVEKQPHARRRLGKALGPIDRSKVAHYPHSRAVENGKVREVKVARSRNMRLPAVRGIPAGVPGFVVQFSLLLLKSLHRDAG